MIGSERLWWGIKFSDGQGRSFLLFDGWDHPRAINRPIEEPPRVLLFRSRDKARAWCKTKRATWSEGDGIVRKWKVTELMVRETVRTANEVADG